MGLGSSWSVLASCGYGRGRGGGGGMKPGVIKGPSRSLSQESSGFTIVDCRLTRSRVGGAQSSAAAGGECGFGISAGTTQDEEGDRAASPTSPWPSPPGEGTLKDALGSLSSV